MLNIGMVYFSHTLFLYVRGCLCKEASIANVFFLQFRKGSANFQASWDVKRLRKLDVILMLYPPYSKQLRNNYFWLHKEQSSFLTRRELKS